jgi:hypothetical protein
MIVAKAAKLLVRSGIDSENSYRETGRFGHDLYPRGAEREFTQVAYQRQPTPGPDNRP